MRWPPNKAWTSIKPFKGYRHFVAINYGGKGDDRWINLVSVLDGEARLKVLWKELKDSSQWMSGWHQLPREEEKEFRDSFISVVARNEDNLKGCLHPSKDSGLIIPCEIDSNRPWFED